MSDDNKIYETLHSPFSIERHKDTFIGYLEAIMYEDGTVEYAVPSHQAKMIEVCMKKLNISREELTNLCPEDMRFDFYDWLCDISGCIMLWYEFHMGKCNEIQAKKLKEFKKHGIFIGDIKIKCKDSL